MQRAKETQFNPADNKAEAYLRADPPFLRPSRPLVPRVPFLSQIIIFELKMLVVNNPHLTNQSFRPLVTSSRTALSLLLVPKFLPRSLFQRDAAQII